MPCRQVKPSQARFPSACRVRAADAPLIGYWLKLGQRDRLCLAPVVVGISCPHKERSTMFKRRGLLQPALPLPLHSTPPQCSLVNVPTAYIRVCAVCCTVEFQRDRFLFSEISSTPCYSFFFYIYRGTPPLRTDVVCAVGCPINSAVCRS